MRPIKYPAGNAFARAVRNERKVRKINIREAARQANLSHSTFSRVENGYLPDIETLWRLCYWGGFDISRSVRQLIITFC